MLAEQCDITPQEALSGLLAECQVRLARDADWERVVAYLVLNLTPIADLIASDEVAMPAQRVQ